MNRYVFTRPEGDKSTGLPSRSVPPLTKEVDQNSEPTKEITKAIGATYKSFRWNNRRIYW